MTDVFTSYDRLNFSKTFNYDEHESSESSISLNSHIDDFETVECSVYSIRKQLEKDNAREDMQIKTLLLEQYMQFWKERFNCVQVQLIMILNLFIYCIYRICKSPLLHMESDWKMYHKCLVFLQRERG
jgi:hypothetical protein